MWGIETTYWEDKKKKKKKKKEKYKETRQCMGEDALCTVWDSNSSRHSEYTISNQPMIGHDYPCIFFMRRCYAEPSCVWYTKHLLVR